MFLHQRFRPTDACSMLAIVGNVQPNSQQFGLWWKPVWDCSLTLHFTECVTLGFLSSLSVGVDNNTSCFIQLFEDWVRLFMKIFGNSRYMSAVYYFKNLTWIVCFSHPILSSSSQCCHDKVSLPYDATILQLAFLLLEISHWCLL